MTFGPIHLPALAARMGDWKYYTTVMQLRDVAERIQFASEINEVRPGHQLSDLIQRALREGRPVDISKYLKNESDHFFNSLVVAVYGGDPEWMEFNVNPAAGSHVPKSGDVVPEWARSAFGYLRLSGRETLFALDGQHRLAGIKLAVPAKNEVGNETLSVIFVSHKRSEAGRRRTRKLFTTLNKMAKAINKSEIIALDESDTGAIITRRLVEGHPFFSRGQVLTKYGTTNLSATDSAHFMTIITLYDVVTYVLGYIVNSLKGDGRAELKYVRPSDAELDGHYKKVEAFLERFVASIPELKEYFSKTGDAAKAVIKRERFTNKSVLFRVVGLTMFLRLTPELKRTEGNVNAAIKVLALLPRHFTDRPYRDVIYSVSGNRILSGKTRLTQNLLRHMLGLKIGDAARLKKDYAEAIGEAPATAKLPRRIAGRG